MKNLLTSLLLLFAVTASAQTAGIILQPEFNTSNIRKGFFVESNVFKGLGVYSDFKMLNNDKSLMLDGQMYSEYNAHEQVNVGLSYNVIRNLKAVASRSVINTKKTSYRSEIMSDIGEKRAIDPTYQFAAMYSESFLSVLLGYEIEQNATSKRITFGLGFNF